MQLTNNRAITHVHEQFTASTLPRALLSHATNDVLGSRADAVSTLANHPPYRLKTTP